MLNGVIGVRKRETTALLAVLAELLVDDRTAQIRCRQELAERDDHLPRWITALPQVDVYRAVRRTHILGDVDELLIGMRLGGGREMTVVVLIDHNIFSAVADAGALPDSIDDALDRAAESGTDTNVVEISLADARASIETALAKPTFSETQTWPHYRALVQWLVGRLPEGGECRSPAWEWGPTEELCDRFFTSRSAAPFSDSCHRELLLDLLETGTGDPLRWSVARVEMALDDWQRHDDRMPLEVALDAPDLLRAFIPFAHAQSGIQDELTSRAVAVIDERRSSYKREVLRQAKYWDSDDEAG